MWWLGEHPPGERVRIYVGVGAPGFEEAPLEPSLPKVDMLLLTLSMFS